MPLCRARCGVCCYGCTNSCKVWLRHQHEHTKVLVLSETSEGQMMESPQVHGVGRLPTDRQYDLLVGLIIRNSKGVINYDDIRDTFLALQTVHVQEGSWPPRPPDAYLLTEGREFMDQVCKSRSEAERRARERNDGTKVIPLYRPKEGLCCLCLLGP